MSLGEYSRIRWPFFLKRTSDGPAAFARVLAAVTATDVSSNVECIR